MLKFNIRSKVLLLIMIATILPLIFLNLYWTQSQRQVLIKNTKTRQTLATANAASAVSNFLNDKVRAFIIHSQSITLEKTNVADAKNELKTLLFQDSDISRVALTDKNGQEVGAIASNGRASPLQNDSQSPAFKVVDYYAGNQYIGPVSIDSSGVPTITIAVPIVSYTTPQNLASLSTSEPGVIRSADSISGTIIAQVKLQDLWSTVLSNANNVGGTAGSYIYVVDQNGNIIAYPDMRVVEAHKNVSNIPIIADFLGHISTSVTEGTEQGTSEKGVQVLATYQRLPVTNWAIVVEDPLSSLYKNINNVSYIGIVVALIAIAVMSVISLVLSGFLSEPILRIAEAAKRIGMGDLNVQVNQRRNDELGTLGESINTMGRNLKQSIGKINAQRRQLEDILNNTTDSILAVDELGRVIIANASAAKFFEAEPSALLGQDIQTLLPLSDNKKTVKIDYASIQPGMNLFQDLKYVSPSKVNHYIDVVAFKIVGSTETIITQTIITIHDNTKDWELDNMKLDFVSMAAHELRTPLSAIQGYLELMSVDKQAADLPEKTQYYIAQARVNSKELANLISNLLSVSRIERGALNLRMKKVDLAEMAHQTISSLHFNAEAKDIRLSYEGPESGCFIIADPGALREVVNNLVDNAIKYTSQGGKVSLSLQLEKDRYLLKVQDNGRGIPPNALPHLFTKFYRVHGGLEMGSVGTGLGLYLAKSILEDHRGSITVESIEGTGSVFSVMLPIFDEVRFNEIQSTQTNEGLNKGDNLAWSTKNTAR